MTLSFFASITPLSRIDETEQNIPYRLRIRGVAVDTSVNKNNWRISEKLLEKIAEDMKQTNIRINHGNNVTDVIGKITAVELGENKIIFEGEIIGSDPITTAVKEKIMNGLLDHVSIGMDGFKVVCSVCGKETRNGKQIIHDVEECGASAHEIIMDGTVRELSVVLDPAYEGTKFNIAASFVNALETYLAVTPQNEGVTGEVGDGQKDRPTDEAEKKEGENMSVAPAVVPTGEPVEGKTTSFEDILRRLQEAFSKFETQMTDVEKRLKSLEDVLATKAEAAKTEAAKDEKKDEDMEADYEAKLSKSATVMAASQTSADWIAELEEALRKTVRRV